MVDTKVSKFFDVKELTLSDRQIHEFSKNKVKNETCYERKRFLAVDIQRRLKGCSRGSCRGREGGPYRNRYICVRIVTI